MATEWIGNEKSPFLDAIMKPELHRTSPVHDLVATDQVIIGQFDSWCERGDSNFERLLILRKLQILRRT